jgi:transcriptional regulator with XRE-family HTH domain
VRLRRTLLGFSQATLGEALGLTFQQVQKYESGKNRISASKLWNLTQILDVPVSFFFDGVDEDQAGPTPSGSDPLHSRETLEFVRNYYRITDPKARHTLFEITKALAKMGDE